MNSNGAKLKIHIGNDADILELDKGGPSIVATLYLPEVEKELVYDMALLEDFDSMEFVSDWVGEIKGDAALLNCDFDSEGLDEALQEYFNSYYADDYFDGDNLDGDLP